MEKKNLVARVLSKSDRRINNIHLTKKGELLLEETLPIMKTFAISLQENISDEEIAKAINTIKKVQDNLIKKSTKSCSDN
jgi:DNA-binding MarR family transcriptional regulator